MMRQRSIFFLLIWLIAKTVYPQEKHRELIVSTPQELPDSLGLEAQALLVIVSEVPGLQFESTRQILKTEQRSNNEWQLVVEPDRQILTFRAPGCLPAQTEVLFFKAKHTYRLTVSYARPLPGALLIKTKPDSASLSLNGALLDAKTPYRFDGMPPGRYYVQVTKDGHYPVEKELIVESNQVTEWEVELTQTAVRVQIQVEKKLQDITMLINGEEKGKAPGVIYLEPGSYNLRLKKQGYQPYEKVIDVPSDSAEIRLLIKLQSTKTLPVRIAGALAWYIKASLLASVVTVIVVAILVA
jgi:hypothetical protein